MLPGDVLPVTQRMHTACAHCSAPRRTRKTRSTRKLLRMLYGSRWRTRTGETARTSLTAPVHRARKSNRPLSFPTRHRRQALRCLALVTGLCKPLGEAADRETVVMYGVSQRHGAGSPRAQQVRVVWDGKGRSEPRMVSLWPTSRLRGRVSLDGETCTDPFAPLRVGDHS